MIDIGFRTLVRGFLLIGGIVFLAQGALDGSLADVGLGLLAALVGGVGLWWELNKQTDTDGERENV